MNRKWIASTLLAAQGPGPVATAPGEFDAFIKAEIAKWAKVVKENALKVD